MKSITPKKRLGQHFLKDIAVAKKVAAAVSGEGCDSILEVGPGTGALTKHLIERGFKDFRVVEIDRESVSYLRSNFINLDIIEGDFLTVDIESLFPGTLAVVGNFPYNISGPVLFRVFEHRNRIMELTGMFQHEVAMRICSPPGSKGYGILSVLLQAFYSAEYLFTVPSHVFYPEPGVKSGVIRLRRNGTCHLDCDERLFVRVVKTAFSQRRKIIRNSIKSAFPVKEEDGPFFRMRPEQLSVGQFVELVNWIAARSGSE